jgi:hypothetical protein
MVSTTSGAITRKSAEIRIEIQVFISNIGGFVFKG